MDRTGPSYMGRVEGKYKQIPRQRVATSRTAGYAGSTATRWNVIALLRDRKKNEVTTTRRERKVHRALFQRVTQQPVARSDWPRPFHSMLRSLGVIGA